MTPGGYDSNFNTVILKFVLGIDILSHFCGIVLTWISQNLKNVYTSSGNGVVPPGNKS